MPRSTLINRQAVFQEALLEIAYERAQPCTSDESKNEELYYDIRGRFIYHLKLSNADLWQIYKKLKNDGDESAQMDQELPANFDRNAMLDTLRTMVGINFTEEIRCNLGLDSLERRKQYNFPSVYEHILSKLPALGRMSIIPLCEELLNHIEHHDAAIRRHLLKHVYTQGHIPPDIEIALQDSLLKAKQYIQGKVVDVSFDIAQEAQGIIKAGGTFTIAACNRILDSYRLESEESKKIWLQRFKEKTQAHQDIPRIVAELSKGSLKKTYKLTPAHPYDILGIDFTNRMVTYTTASKHTSHSKKEWPAGESALRFLVRAGIDKAGHIRSRAKISARIPSIVTKLSDDPRRFQANKQADIENIALIFSNIHEEFDRFSGQDDRPIVYNLFTSLNSTLRLENIYDRMGVNKQNESADRILQGAHAYNKKVAGRNKNNYVWVQNLGVNHHSEDLDVFMSSSLQKEAKLMADIAILHTLKDNLKTPALNTAYDEVVAEYKLYLENQVTPKQFHATSRGKKAAGIISKYKKAIDNDIGNVGLKTSLVDIASQALLNIYKQNLHYKEEYGSLVQVLSIFIEQRSIAGCKSGIDRASTMQKEVAVLIALEAHPKHPKLQYLKTQLECFADHASVPIDNVRKALDIATNDIKMYGDEDSVNHSDLGAAGKFENMPSRAARLVYKTGLYMVERLGFLSAVAFGLGAAIGGILTLFPLTTPLGLIILAGSIIGLKASAGITGLGLLAVSTTFFTKTYDTNKGAAIEFTNNVTTKNVSAMQSPHSAEHFIGQVKKWANELKANPVPPAASLTSYASMSPKLSQLSKHASVESAGSSPPVLYGPPFASMESMYYASDTSLNNNGLDRG